MPVSKVVTNISDLTFPVFTFGNETQKVYPLSSGNFVGKPFAHTFSTIFSSTRIISASGRCLGSGSSDESWNLENIPVWQVPRLTALLARMLTISISQAGEPGTRKSILDPPTPVGYSYSATTPARRSSKANRTSNMNGLFSGRIPPDHMCQLKPSPWAPLQHGNEGGQIAGQPRVQSIGLSG